MIGRLTLSDRYAAIWHDDGSLALAGLPGFVVAGLVLTPEEAARLGVLLGAPAGTAGDEEAPRPLYGDRPLGELTPAPSAPSEAERARAAALWPNLAPAAALEAERLAQLIARLEGELAHLVGKAPSQAPPLGPCGVCGRPLDNLTTGAIVVALPDIGLRKTVCGSCAEGYPASWRVASMRSIEAPPPSGEAGTLVCEGCGRRAGALFNGLCGRCVWREHEQG